MREVYIIPNYYELLQILQNAYKEFSSPETRIMYRISPPRKSHFSPVKFPLPPPPPKIALHINTGL